MEKIEAIENSNTYMYTCISNISTYLSIKMEGFEMLLQFQSRVQLWALWDCKGAYVPGPLENFCISLQSGPENRQGHLKIHRK